MIVVCGGVKRWEVKQDKNKAFLDPICLHLYPTTLLMDHRVKVIYHGVADAAKLKFTQTLDPLAFRYDRHVTCDTTWNA